VLDLGSCLPSADPGEAERIWSAYAQVTARTLHARGWDATQVVLEPGTPVAAHTTHLVARVLDVRRQPHRTVATVAASILNSSPIRRRVDLPVRLVERPGGGRRTDPDSVSVAGGTLIDGDWLALDLPWSIRPGDFVVVDSVGSYSLGLDTAFIDPQLPVVVREGDEWVTARRRPSDDEACAGFVW
jgi:diaminopimelate decarboxylase